LIDDEPLALDRLERLLASHPEVRVLGKISRPSEALAQIEETVPDLLFLDIQMPGLSGFELLGQLRHQPWVIFVTAYDRYALQAFEANSIDYLLKPVEQERLDRSLAKFFQLTRQAGESPAVMPDWNHLLKALQAQAQNQSPPQRLVSRKGERILLVDPAEVVYFYAESKYTFAVTAREEHILDYTLQQLRTWLPGEKFLTIHRSYLVNLDWVAELNRGFGGGMLCRLKPPMNKDLPISRALLRQVRERLRF
jgi:two-component system LytT family response regulator